VSIDKFLFEQRFINRWDDRVHGNLIMNYE
jgi:hypothetical protein